MGPPTARGAAEHGRHLQRAGEAAHEYKRQLLNVLHIIALYQQLQDDPDMDFPPQTFLFGPRLLPAMP
ncbi:MAG: glycogen/starch/alpha-glucan phosphorylase [Oscillospiraceae bacterium]